MVSGDWCGHAGRKTGLEDFVRLATDIVGSKKGGKLLDTPKGV